MCTANGNVVSFLALKRWFVAVAQLWPLIASRDVAPFRSFWKRKPQIALVFCVPYLTVRACVLSLLFEERERERKKKKEKETPELSLTLWGFRSSTCVYRNQVIFSSHVKPLLCFSFLLLFFSPFNFAFFPSAFCVHRSRDFFFPLSFLLLR